MLARLRSRLTYANVMATIAVFIALGGSSYATLMLERGSIKRKHIAANAINSRKVADGKLLAKDFKAGQLPTGAQGERGLQGPEGERGLQGVQGPGAVKLRFSAVRSFAEPELLATIGPWEVLGQCSDTFDVDGTNAALIMRGPGNAEVSLSNFAPDGAFENGRTRSVDFVDPVAGSIVMGAYPTSGTRRTAAVVEVQSATDGAVLTANAFADDDAGTCEIVGTAIPAG